jgi:hypothetical protein
MPQSRERMAGSDLEVDIMTLVEEELAPIPVVPELSRKSPKDKREKKKKKSATRESKGKFVIRLKTLGSAQPVEAVEGKGRLGRTAKISTATTVQIMEEGTILSAATPSVQEDVTVGPIQSTDEGIRGQVRHTAQDLRLRTASGSYRRGRKAGKDGRDFDGNNCTEHGGRHNFVRGSAECTGGCNLRTHTKYG